MYAASSTILLNSVKQAEEQHTREAVKEVLRAFTQTLDDLSAAYATLSEWDETYDFVKDANFDYIERNFPPEALATLNVNLVLFIQPSGRLVYGTGFDRIRKKKTPIPQALRAHLSPQD